MNEVLTSTFFDSGDRVKGDGVHRGGGEKDSE
jgi:hypothetical protein